MRLDDIKEHARRCEKARDDLGPHSKQDWFLAAIASAADVPLLVQEIETLKDALKRFGWREDGTC